MRKSVEGAHDEDEEEEDEGEDEEDNEEDDEKEVVSPVQAAQSLSNFSHACAALILSLARFSCICSFLFFCFCVLAGIFLDGVGFVLEKNEQHLCFWAGTGWRLMVLH